MPTVFRSQEHTHSTMGCKGALLALTHRILESFSPKASCKFQLLFKILFLRALIGINIFYLHDFAFQFLTLYSTNQLLSLIIETKQTIILRKHSKIIVNVCTFCSGYSVNLNFNHRNTLHQHLLLTPNSFLVHWCYSNVLLKTYF